MLSELRVFIPVLCLLTPAGCAGGENSQTEARERELLSDPVILELQGEIQEGRDRAQEGLDSVRAWIASEIAFIRQHGANNPTTELAGTFRTLQDLASELDPSGKNSAVMQYIWIQPGIGKQGAPWFLWAERWRGLLGSLETGELQDRIREFPLHPYKILLQVGPRSPIPMLGSDFFPDGPIPVLGALVETGGLVREMSRVAQAVRPPDWFGPFEFREREDLAPRFGGLSSFSSERIENLENVESAYESIWTHWITANNAARELESRVRATEVFR